MSSAVRVSTTGGSVETNHFLKPTFLNDHVTSRTQDSNTLSSTSRSCSVSVKLSYLIIVIEK
jgi:hypothetical protein